RLRLEVAVAEKGEIYAWPGASRFADLPLASLVKGPIGTGPFGVILNLVFMRDVKAFLPMGNSDVNGRRWFDYSFNVAPEDSHFLLKSADNKDWIVSGYEGATHIDAQTGDPVDVRITAVNPPAVTGVCETTYSVRLKRTKVRDEDILLPDLA